MSYIVTYGGKKFDYVNPKPEMIDINDIFRSLSRLNRFVGHSKRTYSVGEHTFFCLLMAEKLGYSTREQLLTFIHDFTEAYVGDCPTPLKNLLPNFKEIEAKVEDVIYKHLGVKPPTEEEHAKIKRIDLTMLILEMRDMTLHKWQDNGAMQFAYKEILEDEEFNLTNPAFINDKAVENALKTCFNDLMAKYKKEYPNG